MSNIPAIARCPFSVYIVHFVHFTKQLHIASQYLLILCPERFIRSLSRGIETAMMHSVETKLTIPYFSVLIVPRLSIDLLWFASRILGEE